ncbi:hypothetical protein ACEPPN_005101 [Leptodophora sp. 'Broadleaf-Isolate-01']
MELDIFWQLTYGGTTYPTYTYVRKNSNYNSPVTDLASNDLRCNAGAGAGDATDTLAVKAGASFTFTSDVAVYHNGATAMYMAKAPTTAKEYDGSGQRWFKILEIGPVWKGNGDPTWPLYQTYTYRIPPATPNGEYLLRIEQLALHNPGGVPQFYIGCAQISVTGGGNGNPGPLVAIPGYVKGTESGYTANIYNNFKSYTLVGPAVWAGQNDTSPVQVPSTTIVPTTLKPVPTPTPTPSPSFILTPIVVPTTSSTLTPVITTPPPLAPVTIISTVYATKWNTSFVFFTATTTATIVTPSILTTTATTTLTSSCPAIATITQNIDGVTVTTTVPALTIISTASASALPGLTTTVVSTSTAPVLTIVSTAPPTTLTVTAPDTAKTITITTLSLFTVTTYDTITSYSTLTETATVTVGSGGSNNVPPANGGGGTIGLWNQCGGKDWTGSGTCIAGATCKFSNEYYSQCVAS